MEHDIVEMARDYGQASRELYEAERALVREERDAIYLAYETSEVSGKNDRERKAQEGNVANAQHLEDLRIARNEAMAKAQEQEALVKLTVAWLYAQKGGTV